MRVTYNRYGDPISFPQRLAYICSDYELQSCKHSSSTIDYNRNLLQSCSDRSVLLRNNFLLWTLLYVMPEVSVSCVLPPSCLESEYSMYGPNIHRNVLYSMYVQQKSETASLNATTINLLSSRHLASLALFRTGLQALCLPAINTLAVEDFLLRS